MFITYFCVHPSVTCVHCAKMVQDVPMLCIEVKYECEDTTSTGIIFNHLWVLLLKTRCHWNLAKFLCSKVLGARWGLSLGKRFNTNAKIHSVSRVAPIIRGGRTSATWSSISLPSQNQQPFHFEDVTFHLVPHVVSFLFYLSSRFVHQMRTSTPKGNMPFVEI